jgi:hypothetical protein
MPEAPVERNRDWQAKVKGLLQSLEAHGGAVTLRSSGATVSRDGERFRVTWPPYGRTRIFDTPGTTLLHARGPAPAGPTPCIVPRGDGSRFGDAPPF